MSATPKQVNLIEDLFTRKGIPAAIQEQTRALYTRADQRPAHEIRTLIDGMFALPDAPTPNATATRPESVDALLRRLEIPVSMYALRTEDLPPAAAHLAHGNSLLFVQVREYKETRYLRVLRGAPGNFNREKPLYNEAVEIASAINTVTPQEAARTFGQHYSCCGSCGADLTDDTSRRLNLGPECRRKFGL